MSKVKYYLFGLVAALLIAGGVPIGSAHALPVCPVNDGNCIDADGNTCRFQNGQSMTPCKLTNSETGNSGDGQTNGAGASGAVTGCDKGGHFMGLRAWYDGDILDGATCQIKTPKDDAELSKLIWTIVLNLATMLLQLVGYLAVGFVIWGGYQYIMARGEPGKVASGRKTIVNAIIGLIVCMTASIITGALGDIISSAAGPDKNFFQEIFNKAFFWAGIVAVIFMVYGGIQYVTSSGDTTKVTKAKNTIMNAAIGLVITILAAAIVNLVIDSLNGTATP